MDKFFAVEESINTNDFDGTLYRSRYYFRTEEAAEAWIEKRTTLLGPEIASQIFEEDEYRAIQNFLWGFNRFGLHWYIAPMNFEEES